MRSKQFVTETCAALGAVYGIALCMLGAALSETFAGLAGALAAGSLSAIAGIALGLTSRRKAGLEQTLRQICIVVIITVTGAIAVTSLLYATGLLDTRFNQETTATAWGFLLLGLALLADHSDASASRTVSRYIAGLLLLFCFVWMVTEIYQLPFWVRDRFFLSDTPLFDLPAWIVLAIGIIALHPDRGIPSLLSSGTLPSAQLRILLPAILLLPLLVGLIVVYLPGHLDMGSSVAITALGTAVVGAMIVLASSVNLNLAENALYLREQALSASRTAIAISDHTQSDEPFVWINDAVLELTGYTRREVLGSNLSMIEVSHPDNLESRREIATALRLDKACTVTLRARRKDGTPFWSRVTLSPVTGRRNRTTHYIITLDDITEQKTEALQLEDALRHASAARAAAEAASSARDTFVSYVGHELRAPLNAARTWIDVMELDPTEDTCMKGVSIIRSSIETQIRLIEDLSDVARISAGQLSVDREQTDLRELVSILGDEIEMSFADKDIRLDMRLPEQPVYMHGDPVRLSQVFRNLLVNAYRYSGEKTAVTMTLETSANPDCAIITVTDTGIGIASSDLETVFAPYWRGEGHGTGLGIGLALARAIVQAHNGQIVACSQGPGTGSTFKVTLPLNGVDADSDAALPNRDADAKDQDQKTTD